jgi:hypothetical protein
MDGVKMLGRRVAVVVIPDLDLVISQAVPSVSIFTAHWAGSGGGLTLHCRLLSLLALPLGHW